MGDIVWVNPERDDPAMHRRWQMYMHEMELIERKRRQPLPDPPQEITDGP